MTSSPSLIPEGPSLLKDAPPPAPPAMRDFGDHKATRSAIYDNVFKAASELEPLTNQRHTLKLSNVSWMDPDRFSVAERKQAIMSGNTLSRRLKGTWSLHDNATGQLLDQRNQVVARVPHLTDMGTFVLNGNDYTLNHQQRLKAGVFVRRKDNGEIEGHANILPGKGVGHRYLLDPEKGIFKIKVSAAEVPVLPLLKAMGASDNEIREAWGHELFATNYQKAEHGALNKLANKILAKVDRESPDEAHRRAKLVEAFTNMEVDPNVMQRTLGIPAKGMTKEVLLATTKKLLAVSRGQAEVDDRDHLAYQTFLGPEDLLAERVRRDHSKIRRNQFFKASLKGHLRDLPSSLMTPQLEQALLGSGLGNVLEEINPAEVLDKQSRITRMGEGGIPSMEAIPDEARGVQPSHMGYMDPLRTPESFRVGVDVQMARGARKGADGKIYAQFKNIRTGKMEWKAPSDLADTAIAFPGSLARPMLSKGLEESARASLLRRKMGLSSPQDEETIRAYERAKMGPPKRVPVMRGGKITYAKRDEVAYELPHFEDAFSHLANLVPGKSMVKGQRVSMGSRYLTQALSLIKPEAPWVRGAVPGTNGDRSFEEEYGKHLGAIHSDKPGRVLKVTPDSITVKHEDGTTQEHELYNNYPFNRKSYFHHTPLVRPGDTFKPGQLLARSNYTDDKGAIALGANMRVAYVPWKGYNYEDAGVISESAAKRFSSEHMYQHNLLVDEKHKLGKKNFVSLFPSKFERPHLDALDDKGVIKPGATVEHGQPLILAGRERDLADNKVHKRGQAGYADVSVLWKHHDPGVVTDVLHGHDGPVVLVKSTSQMQVGDKFSGRYGDKSVVAAIIPDHQMPHDKEGNPFEILMNPLGTISRTNPVQHLELALGKVAALTGKPVNLQDFSSIEDMSEYARGVLRQHGLSDLEDITDPEHNNKIANIATGNRFFMKLQHTSESKSQARGSGGYGLDESPSKGGETGCFVGDTPVLVRSLPAGPEHVLIEDLVRWRLAAAVATRDQDTGISKWGRAVDWFEYLAAPADLVEVELANGEVMVCTRNHVLFLSSGAKVLAGDLTVGQDLMEAPWME